MSSRCNWASNRHHVTTAYFTKPKNDPTFEQRLQTALAAAPGVESAALAYPVPFTSGGLTSGFDIRNRQHLPGEPEWHGEAYFVSPEYLHTLQIPLLRGRNFTEADGAGAPMVCMIDRNLADRFFPNQDPIGQQIAMYKGWAQIVGVVSDVRADGLEDTARPVVYYSLAQIPFFAQSAAIVRSGVPAGNLLRDVIRRTNPAVPVFDVATLDERIGSFLGIRRVLAGLLLAFGGIALLLAAIGIYGVIAQVVSEQTREVGVRMALGARAGQIMALFMRQGLYAGAIGLVAGMAATLLVRALGEYAALSGPRSRCGDARGSDGGNRGSAAGRDLATRAESVEDRSPSGIAARVTLTAPSASPSPRSSPRSP